MCQVNWFTLSTSLVANRDQSTPLAYLLLRLVINSNGELIPKLNNRLERGSDGVSVMYNWRVERAHLVVSTSRFSICIYMYVTGTVDTVMLYVVLILRRVSSIRSPKMRRIHLVYIYVSYICVYVHNVCL